ncbi:hypothetical protein [Clostridium ljungdahlii]|uniref:Uncharacterized protein n=3 Tax=Clostridium TaxID=1485 RepID=D8GQ29_CLOLD|nr:hypothetical protein [Clostridium ljungdahlii]ADK16120.1 hypothetical protein CLJU_c30720 [Clostridium ljungdahlii DSM 13528]OAA84204.1 hypothetical protein WX45_01840 [Clostridium ljungdahlii DSM 13528]
MEYRIIIFLYSYWLVLIKDDKLSIEYMSQGRMKGKIMKIENLKVYDLEESIKASKYPMAVDTDKCNSDITNTVKSLAKSPKGEAHDQFLSGIRVAFDLTFTNKAWVELERYRFITFVSSQSTMHRISKFDLSKQYNEYVDKRIIDIIEELKDTYNKTQDKEDYLKLLYSNPAGFELTARLTTNYRCLKGVYSQRRNHRLPEWREFCKWIETLPYAKELII